MSLTSAQSTHLTQLNNVLLNYSQELKCFLESLKKSTNEHIKSKIETLSAEDKQEYKEEGTVIVDDFYDPVSINQENKAPIIINRHEYKSLIKKNNKGKYHTSHTSHTFHTKREDKKRKAKRDIIYYLCVIKFTSIIINKIARTHQIKKSTNTALNKEKCLKKHLNDFKSV